MRRRRRIHSPAIKSRVALAALEGNAELAQRAESDDRPDAPVVGHAASGAASPSADADRSRTSSSPRSRRPCDGSCAPPRAHTIEGNTNTWGSREGDRRLRRTRKLCPFMGDVFVRWFDLDLLQRKAA